MKKIFSVLVISFFIGVVLFLQAYAQSDNFPSNTFGSSTTTSQPSLESTKSCPEYWMPVCAQPPMPRCPEGLSCLTVMPPLKTYSNKECAAVDNAELVYEGECRGDNDSRPNPRPACRKDAKVCPDGSTVERTGSNCEFAACPAERNRPNPNEPICRQDAKVCPDGSTVERTGSNCEFAACPGEIRPNPNPLQNVNVCPDLYDPVCGADGVTYGNRCDTGDIQVAYRGSCENLINRQQLQRLNNRYEARYRALVIDTPRQNLMTAIERIDKQIESTRNSRITLRAQESRITALVFFRNIFEDAIGR